MNTLGTLWTRKASVVIRRVDGVELWEVTDPTWHEGHPEKGIYRDLNGAGQRPGFHWVDYRVPGATLDEAAALYDTAHPLDPVTLAGDYAYRVHEGKRYGERSYFEGHLQIVVDLLQKGLRAPRHVLASGYLHDVLEDCPEDQVPKHTQAIRDQCGAEVLALTQAVTLPKGKNRRERFRLWYPTLSSAPPWTEVLKMADRICNVRSCYETYNPMIGMYLGEYHDFRGAMTTRALPGEEMECRVFLLGILDKLMGWRERS